MADDGRLRRRLRLLPAAGVAWATAAFTTAAPDRATEVAGGLWATALTLVLVLSVRPRAGRRDTFRGVAVVLVVALAAGGAAASHVALAHGARAELATLAVDGGRFIEVRANVIGKVERRVDGTLAFDARASAVRIGSVEHSVTGEIVVRVAPGDIEGDRDDLDVGAVVAARGTARPGDAGERAVLELRAGQGLTVLTPPQGILAVSAGLRHGLVRAVAGLPEPGAGLVPGLSVGDTSAVSVELDAAMKRSALSHLTAVSGANCALVVGIAFFAAAALGARRSARVVAGLSALAGFVVLVTPEPSVVRAATMAAIAMVGLLLGRTGVGVSVLSLAVTVLLIADPWLAHSLGFALSAAATGSLLVFARPLADGLARRLPRALALMLAVPLAAQLACGPLLVLIEPSVPLYGVLANLLAAPAAPAGTVVGLAACLAAPLPWVQQGLAAVAWLPAAWVAATAHTATALPGDLLPWVEGPAGAVLLGAVGAALGILIGLRPGRGRRRAVRAACGALVAIVIGVATGNAAAGTVAGSWTLPGDWRVLVCDVGQGDAVLVRSGAAIALIDTGPEPERLEACLARVGVSHIDLLVLTHFDLDHVGGVAAVRGRVDAVLHGPPATADDERLLAGLAQHGADSVFATAGMQGMLGAARWRVLWPRAHSPAFPHGNDASVVLDIGGGDVPRTLLLGDLSAGAQTGLAASGQLDPPYALVKVAHHGSADQHVALYARADPAVALVTVGAENRYGHPRREILDALTVLGGSIARTDTHGMIALSVREGSLRIWRERG
ncbi:ComEC/Rec2 family competence protein [Microbacterium sp. NPDC055357]